MKEREPEKKEPKDPVHKLIYDVLGEEGPCSTTKITRLVNERLDGQTHFRKPQIAERLETMRVNGFIETCFFAGEVPPELKKADVRYGYFRADQYEELVGTKIKGRVEFNLLQLARDEDLDISSVGLREYFERLKED